MARFVKVCLGNTRCQAAQVRAKNCIIIILISPLTTPSPAHTPLSQVLSNPISHPQTPQKEGNRLTQDSSRARLGHDGTGLRRNAEVVPATAAVSAPVGTVLAVLDDAAPATGAVKERVLELGGVLLAASEHEVDLVQDVTVAACVILFLLASIPETRHPSTLGREHTSPAQVVAAVVEVGLAIVRADTNGQGGNGDSERGLHDEDVLALMMTERGSDVE